MVVMQSRALHGVANFGRGQWLRVELLATTNHDYYVNINFKHLNSKVSWCSWLSRQSNTLKVSGSSPGEANLFAFFLFLQVFPAPELDFIHILALLFFFSLYL